MTCGRLVEGPREGLLTWGGCELGWMRQNLRGHQEGFSGHEKPLGRSQVDMLGACVKAESVRDPGRPVRHLRVVGEREQESILGKKMGASSRC